MNARSRAVGVALWTTATVQAAPQTLGYTFEPLQCTSDTSLLVVGVTQAREQFGPAGGVGAGDVLDEGEAERQVLVLCGVHVGGGPERLLDVAELSPSMAPA